MKDLKQLKGTRTLSKNEQRSIRGGVIICDENNPCPANYLCLWDVESGICVKH